MRLTEILMAHIKQSSKPIFSESLDPAVIRHLQQVEDRQVQEALRQRRENENRRLRRLRWLHSQLLRLRHRW